VIAQSSGLTGGLAWGDYDNDGFLDLIVTRWGPDFAVPGRNVLFHNTGNSNAWLKVRCLGTASNRSAIGAKVRVQATIGEKNFWQLREITSGDGFNGNSLIAHFGLGDATNIEALRIEWPSGTVQVMTNVPTRQSLTIIEPPTLKALSKLSDNAFQLSLTGGIGFRYDIETSSDLTLWNASSSLICTNRTMTLTDTNTIDFSDRFYRAVMR
jgi:hypothetical protein